MAIRCSVFDCRYNYGGWCDLDYIEINVGRTCTEYEPAGAQRPEQQEDRY